MNQNISRLADILYYSNLLSKEAANEIQTLNITQNANMAAAYLIMSGYPYIQEGDFLSLSVYGTTFKVEKSYLIKVYGKESYNAMLSRSVKEMPGITAHVYHDISDAMESGDYDAAIQKVLQYADETFVSMRKEIEDSDVSTTLLNISQKIDKFRISESNELRELKKMYDSFQDQYTVCTSALTEMGSIVRSIYSMISVLEERGRHSDEEVRRHLNDKIELRRANMILFSKAQQAQSAYDQLLLRMNEMTSGSSASTITKFEVPSITDTSSVENDGNAIADTESEAPGEASGLPVPDTAAINAPEENAADPEQETGGVFEEPAIPAQKAEPENEIPVINAQELVEEKNDTDVRYESTAGIHADIASRNYPGTMEIDIDDIMPVEAPEALKTPVDNKEVTQSGFGQLVPSSGGNIRHSVSTPIARAALSKSGFRFCWKQYNLKIPDSSSSRSDLLVEFIFCPCFGKNDEHLVMVGISRQTDDEHYTIVRTMVIKDRLHNNNGTRLTIGNNKFIANDITFFVGTTDVDMEYDVELMKKNVTAGYALEETETFSCSGNKPGHLILDTNEYRAEIVPVLFYNNENGFADIIYKLTYKNSETGELIPTYITGATDDRDGIELEYRNRKHLVLTRWEGDTLLAEQIN